jgi:hypothetical protein
MGGDQGISGDFFKKFASPKTAKWVVKYDRFLHISAARGFRLAQNEQP